MVEQLSAKEARTKWKNLLEGVDDKGESLGMAPIKDAHRRQVTAVLLENTQKEMLKEQNTTAGIDIIDPVMISMVRRLAPNLNGYDMVGIQPMTGPTGTIFALRAHYGDQIAGPFGRPGDGRTGFQTGSALDTAGNTVAQQWGVNGVGTEEAFYYEADTTFSGTGTQTSNLSAPNYSSYSVGTAMSTATGEALTGSSFGTMSITIEKTAVEAKTRKMRALYTHELAQDLKAVHGLDAENELAGFLGTEMTAEINREVVNTVRMVALVANGDIQYSNGNVIVDSSGNAVLSATGVFDLDLNSDGRWSSEKYKTLLVKINKTANQIAKQTRRGRGNFIICSSDVASILDLTGKMVYAPALDNNLTVDDTGNTFVGVLQGRFKVYIDPYLGYDEIIVGYKGPSPIDAGMFYCPYVPLQMIKAVDPASFQPALAYQTRYGIVSNPFTSIQRNTNLYFVKFRVKNI